ncbi:hypothetical protein QW71_17425, partial [Paenibacillus sp. IHB B 3415]|uniref:hypothetical protein n=1 Tax=Paenibacillus sp. IHB B 3415 TaxID=867080 RepID=UPI00057499EE
YQHRRQSAPPPISAAPVSTAANQRRRLSALRLSAPPPISAPTHSCSGFILQAGFFQHNLRILYPYIPDGTVTVP